MPSSPTTRARAREADCEQKSDPPVTRASSIMTKGRLIGAVLINIKANDQRNAPGVLVPPRS
jgi:hypothetical protein